MPSFGENIQTVVLIDGKPVKVHGERYHDELVLDIPGKLSAAEFEFVVKQLIEKEIYGTRCNVGC